MSVSAFAVSKFVRQGMVHSPSVRQILYRKFCQQPRAVADAGNRDAKGENALIHIRRAGGIDAVRSSGEDDADGVICPNFCQRHGAGMHLAIDMIFADTAGSWLYCPPKSGIKTR